MSKNKASKSPKIRTPIRRSEENGRSKTTRNRATTRSRGRALRGTKPARRTKPLATKKQICLDLLRRRKGATIDDLQDATGWQAHSVRGFLSGTVRKKLGLTVVSKKTGSGSRRYRIPAAEA